MAINERLIDTEVADAGNGGAGTGNQEEGLILHLDANDVDSYDGDGSIWYDIKDHEYTPATNVSEHFNTVIYTGNNSSKSITGLGFQPDLVWVKNRTNANSHNLIDSLRGANETLFSNTTNAESTRSSVTSFDSDGFSLGNYVGVNGNYNYVAWCFKAGGAPTSTNTGGQTPTSGSKIVDGTAVTDNYPTADIYPTKQSVNTKLGFSVTEYTGAGSGKYLPHGLDVPPEMYIIKATSSTGNWWVYTTSGGDFQYLKLNGTDAGIDADQYYNRPTANLIQQGQSSNTTNIMYAFASKRGVSKVGSFVGTGTSGKKIYTGFEPAFIITKRSSSSGANWAIIDNKRSTDSDKNDYLAADTLNAEATSGSGITFNRDGFTFNGGSFNTNGATHIYYAVAKDTNETSLIPDTDLELHLDAGDNTTVSASTWTDLTSNSYDGTFTNFSSTLTDFYEKELGNFITFDGTNDYVKINNTSLTKSVGTDFAVEAWVRMHTTGTADYIVSQTTDDGNYQNWLLRFHSDNKIKFYVYGTDAYLSTTSTYSANVWYHIVGLVESNGTVRIYVNGDLEASSSSGKSADTVARNTFIGSLGSQQTIDADIGQVRIYHTALTQDQIRQNFNFTKNDYPNGYNGTITSATHNAGGYFDVTGASNSGVEINGLTTQITPNGNDSTMGGWFRKDNTNLGTLWSKGTSSNYELQVLEGGGNNLKYIFYRRSGSSVAIAQSNSSLSANTWYHIMGVIDWSNQDVKIYLNGSLVGTNTTWSHSTSNQHLTGSIFLGRRNDNSGNLDGKVSEFKVYDKVLTSTEITAIFDEDKANYGY